MRGISRLPLCRPGYKRRANLRRLDMKTVVRVAGSVVFGESSHSER